MFSLHPTLQADTAEIGQFPVCTALLMNNAHLPWIILVPKRAGIREMHELSQKDQQAVFQESLLVGKTLLEDFNGDKLNTAAIGNMVPQLHLHHIVRFKHDPVWPQPVWGNLPNKKYTQIKLGQMLKRLRRLLENASSDFICSE